MTDDEDATDETPVYKRVPWRRLGNVVGLLVLLAVVVPFVIFALPQVAGGNGSYVVLSGSMEPAISPGDVIITDSVETSAIESGDVITFRRSGDDRPTTHRVVEVVERNGDPAFQTKGDANENRDQQLVTPGDVQGRVMTVGGYLFVIPFIGHLIQFTNTQIGFTALFVVPLVLLVISEIWSTAKAARATSDGDESSDSAAGNDTDVTADDGDSRSETAGDDEADEGSVTFTAAELQLGVIVLGLFLGYSLWVTYVTLEIWAFAVTGSVATAFLLFGAVYAFGGETDGSDGDTGDETDGSEADDDASEVGNETDEPTPEIDTEEEVAILSDALQNGTERTGEKRRPEPTEATIEPGAFDWDNWNLESAGSNIDDSSRGETDD